MTRLHIIGRKNHGKTRLVMELVRELTGRGLRIGTIKHTHHEHELDTPGKDSHDHRVAGAAVVGVLSPGLSAVFVPQDANDADAQTHVYEQLMPLFESCDLVLVEGDSEAQAPKIEVWRAGAGPSPLAQDDPSVLAIVTDDPIELPVTLLSRADVATLADWILREIPGRT
jgi:molybdopterin-guanine dinucleotide biosynthesis protein MobB